MTITTLNTASLWDLYGQGMLISLIIFMPKKNALCSSSLLKSLLRQLSLNTTQVDVISHSMENRLILEALDYESPNNGIPPIQSLFALAPAVNDASIDKNHQFFPSTQNVLEVEILYPH